MHATNYCTVHNVDCMYVTQCYRWITLWQISTMLDKAVFDDALFVSVRQLPDESGSSK